MNPLRQRWFFVWSSRKKYNPKYRGQTITKEVLAEFVETLDIPEHAKQTMRDLTPSNYIGNAVAQAKAIWF